MLCACGSLPCLPRLCHLVGRVCCSRAWGRRWFCVTTAQRRGRRMSVGCGASSLSVSGHILVCERDAHHEPTNARAVQLSSHGRPRTALNPTRSWRPAFAQRRTSARGPISSAGRGTCRAPGWWAPSPN